MTMRPMAQREMMDPGSVASDKSLAATEPPGGRASASRQGSTDHVRRGYPHRGTLRNQSKLRSLDAVLLWPGAMVRAWVQLSRSLLYNRPGAQPQGQASGRWVTPLRAGRASKRQAVAPSEGA